MNKIDMFDFLQITLVTATFNMSQTTQFYCLATLNQSYFCSNSLCCNNKGVYKIYLMPVYQSKLIKIKLAITILAPFEPSSISLIQKYLRIQSCQVIKLGKYLNNLSH